MRERRLWGVYRFGVHLYFAQANGDLYGIIFFAVGDQKGSAQHVHHEIVAIHKKRMVGVFADLEKSGAVEHHFAFARREMRRPGQAGAGDETDAGSPLPG